MPKEIVIANRRVPIVVFLIIALPLGIAGWWVNRTIHWKFAYESKVEAKIESLTQEVKTLRVRVDAVEAAVTTRTAEQPAQPSP